VIEKRNDHGQKVRYTYYDNGWLKTIKDETTGAYSYFEYDKSGRRILEQTQTQDDLKRIMRQQTITNYDSHGRIESTTTNVFKDSDTVEVTTPWQEGQTISQVTYQYDAVGNRRSMRVENGLLGEITGNPPDVFYGELVGAQENTELDSDTGSVAQFFEALQIDGLRYSIDKIAIQSTSHPEIWGQLHDPRIEGVEFTSAGLLTGTPSYDSSGVYRLYINATDSTKQPNKVYKGEIIFEIEDIPAAIEIKPIPKQEQREGESVNIDLSEYFAISNPQTRDIQFELIDLPAALSGLSIDNQGVISGPLSYDSHSGYTVKVRVLDKNDETAERLTQFELLVKNTERLQFDEEQKTTMTLEEFFPSLVGKPEFQALLASGTLRLSGDAHFATLSEDKRSVTFTMPAELVENVSSKRFSLLVELMESNPEAGNRVISGHEVFYHITVNNTHKPNQALNATGGVISRGVMENGALEIRLGDYFENNDLDPLNYVVKVYKQYYENVGGEFELKTRELPSANWVSIAKGSSPEQDVLSISPLLGDSNSNPYKVEVIATESNRLEPNTAIKTFSIKVDDYQPPISARKIPNITRRETEFVNYNVAQFFSTYPASRELVYSISGLPGDVTYNAATGEISEKPGYNATDNNNEEDFTISVTATDSINSSVYVQQSFTLTVKNVPNIIVNEGGNADISLAGIVDGGQVEYKIIGTAPKHYFSGDTLIINPSPTDGDHGGRQYIFFVRATEVNTDLGASDSKEIHVFVNDTQTPNRAPTATNSTRDWDENEVIDINNGSITGLFSDPDGDALVYSVRYEKLVYESGEDKYKPSSAPSGLSFNAQGGYFHGTLDKSRTVNGTATGGSYGNYRAFITATEKHRNPANSVIATVDIRIDQYMAPISARNIDNITRRETEFVNYNVAQFFSTYPASRDLVYSISGLPGDVTYDALTGKISGKPGYNATNNEEQERFTISVTATDSTNSSIYVQKSFTLTVKNVPNITVNEGGSVNISLAGIVDGGQVEYSVIGTAPHHWISGDTLTIQPSVTDGDNGGRQYIFFVRATEVNTDLGASDSKEIRVFVNDTQTPNYPVTSVNGTKNWDEGNNINIAKGSVAGLFSDGNNDVLTYSVVYEKLTYVNGEDRYSPSSAPSGLSFNQDGGYFYGTLNPGSYGDYRAYVTATEKYRTPANSATAMVQMTVNYVAPPITADPYTSSESFDEKDFARIDAGRYFSSNGTLKYKMSGAPSDLHINSSTGEISGDLGYSSAGSYSIKVVAYNEDDLNINADVTILLTVRNTLQVTIKEFGDYTSSVIGFIGESHNGTIGIDGGQNWMSVVNKKLVLKPLNEMSGGSRLYKVKVTWQERGTVLVEKQAFHITLTNNSAPTGGISRKEVPEGQPFTHNTAQNFKDPDGDSLTYTAAFYKKFWAPGTGGEGSGSWKYSQYNRLPAGVSFASNGMLSGTQSTTSGEYKVIVTATESSGSGVSSQREFILKINHVAPNQAPTVTGLAVRDRVDVSNTISANATARDSDGSIAAYGWRASSHLRVLGSGSAVTLKGLSAGQGWVEVRVKDDDGLWSAWSRKTVNVSVPSPANRAPVANKTLWKLTFSGKPMGYTIPSDTFTDPDGDSLTYTASGLPSGLRLVGNRISGTTYSTGRYTVTITARDPRGLTASTTLTLEVEPDEFGGMAMRSALSSAPMQFAAAPKMLQKSSLSEPAAPMQMQSTPASTQSSSSSQLNIKKYWFTYDNNNRVVVDGGSLGNNQIGINKQGQHITYNAAGQQQLVIGDKGTRAQHFMYNSWGQVSTTRDYFNQYNSDLFSIRSTLANNPVHENWRLASQFNYNAMGMVTEKRDYFDANIYSPHKQSDSEGVYSWTTKLYYGGEIRSITETDYNKSGELISTREQGLREGVKVKLDSYVNLHPSEPSGNNPALKIMHTNNAWSSEDLRALSDTSNYVYHSAGNVARYTYHQFKHTPAGSNL
ncbi:putative Ig domain-containing protein, partial [Pseudoalteromonas holothuriae]|uniref:putative Ig domain-containing protein n=1 Tax=Pseudoalteromonas holothuriae TaxID=2963714 RepID=UPI0021C0B7BD